MKHSGRKNEREGEKVREREKKKKKIRQRTRDIVLAVGRKLGSE